ncbi:hypothetical protein Vadar_012333 [Vaccinium darrowii]|uniref:Uncharacterized protein n=1 Tax=Vaccinium darrowii TaxID=229202 RepID=A0ACB7XI73_9ERIC|nr:hypothetical protein Vadar_012333 [Vaccinium darrowii]
MSEDMNLSVNGQSRVPPGFRFHPTEEELLHYYLTKKVASEKIDLDVIRDVDLNKLEPWDIQEKCKIGSTPQNDWYFFSHKDKKYPTGTRTNRATAAGFWKATGRDKVIYSCFRRIGMRKTLVFYKGRAPHGQKSDWIMHEYRLDDTTHDTSANNLGGSGDSFTEEGWVVCRVFKKKNYNKALESPQCSSTSTDMIRTQLRNISTNDGVLDQILHYMGRSCKQEINQTINTTTNNNNMLFLPPINATIDTLQDRFAHLPRLESDHNSSPFNQDHPCLPEQAGSGCRDGNPRDGLSDWVALDRLVASQLNGQDDTSKHLSSYGDDPNDDFSFSVDDHDDAQISQLRLNRSSQSSEVLYGNEIDLWSFVTRSPSSSSSDPLGHFSV